MKNVPPCNTVQGQLQDTVDSLEYRRDELDRENLSLARTHDELMRSNADLTEKAARPAECHSAGRTGRRRAGAAHRHPEKNQGRLGDCRGDKPAEEIPYLSQPLFSLGIQPSAQNHLTAYGLRYVGDLVRRDEQYLMEIWGIGPATVRADKDQTERERRIS